MKTSGTNTSSKPISAAQLRANRLNARKSTGPSEAGKRRSRLNAVKHGLTAQSARVGPTPARDLAFRREAWKRLGPRNHIEVMHVKDLLRGRIMEAHLLDAERALLSRKPILLPDAAAGPFPPWLGDDRSLDCLEQLARYLTHHSLNFERSVVALLRAREDAAQFQSNSGGAYPLEPSIELEDQLATTGTFPSDLPPATSPTSLGELEGYMADLQVVLPEESADKYRQLVRGVWETLNPQNELERFAVMDVAQAEWRLGRVSTIYKLLVNRYAVSATGHDCGPAFGFLHAAQQGRGLEALRHYEGAVRRHRDRRLALWRKVRKAKWTDCDVPASPGCHDQPPEPSPAIPPQSSSTPTNPEAAVPSESRAGVKSSDSNQPQGDLH